MTVEEVAECKKYAESKGFVLFHYKDAVAEEDTIKRWKAYKEEIKLYKLKEDF